MVTILKSNGGPPADHKPNAAPESASAASSAASSATDPPTPDALTGENPTTENVTAGNPTVGNPTVGNPASEASDAVAPVLPANGCVGRIPGGVTGLVNFNLDDFAQNSLQQLERCRQHIDAMLAQARQDAEQIAEEARRRGYAAGQAEAEVDMANQIAQAAEVKAKAQLASLQQAVQRAQQQYQAWMASYTSTLSELTIAAAERILNVKLEQDPTLIAEWAREALHSTRSAARLTLAVHPDTLADLGEMLEDLLKHPDLPEHASLVPDASLAPGDVRVRQDGGEIKAGLLDQLNRLREVLP